VYGLQLFVAIIQSGALCQDSWQVCSSNVFVYCVATAATVDLLLINIWHDLHTAYLQHCVCQSMSGSTCMHSMLAQLDCWAYGHVASLRWQLPQYVIVRVTFFKSRLMICAGLQLLAPAGDAAALFTAVTCCAATTCAHAMRHGMPCSA
jgi:hypothetical protein